MERVFIGVINAAHLYAVIMFELMSVHHQVSDYEENKVLVGKTQTFLRRLGGDI
jgi:hypothetical protein